MGLQQQPSVRGALVSVGVNPEIRCNFQFNPSELQDRRTVTYASIGTPGAFVPNRQYAQGGDRTITFSVDLDGTRDGPDGFLTDQNGCITPELNKYRAFVNPRTDNWQQVANSTFASLYTSSQDLKQFVPPPSAVFIYGDMTISCIVTDLSITEKLFDPNLGVLRAKVAITLIEQVDFGNEPTSPPGA